MRDDPPAWFCAVFGVAGFALFCITLFCLFGLVPAYFEAAAYKRVTGQEVSTWDAVFLDLRVQEGVAK